MLKKIGITTLLVMIIVFSIFALTKDKIYFHVRKNPTLSSFVKRFISGDKKSSSQILQKTIAGEIDITVNVSKTIGEFKPFYNGIGMGTFNDGVLTSYNKAFFELIAETNKKHPMVQYINMKSIFRDKPNKKWRSDDGAHVYQQDRSGNVSYNWKIVDAVIDELLRNGVKPIISFTFMPKDLASDPRRVNPWHRAIVSPPNDYSKWRDLIYQTVAHLKESYGSSEIRSWYFEVWNEPDLFRYFWISHPDKKQYPNLSDFETYTKLYDYTVDGALAADESIKIGGPGLAGDKRFLREFLKHCVAGKNFVTGETGSRIDFVSRHHYGEIEDRIIPQYTDFMEVIKNTFGEPFRDLEILITETGPSANPKPWLNNRYVAAWIVKEADAFLDLSDKMGSDYLPDIVCFWSKPVSSVFGNQFGLVTALGNKHSPSPNSIVKRPAFNSHQAINWLSGDRIELTGVNFGDPIHGIATKGKDSAVTIILYHLDEKDVFNDNRREYPINLKVAGCEHADYSFEYYVINETHSNGFNLWNSMGSPSYPTPNQLLTLQAKDDLLLFEPVHIVKTSNGVIEKRIMLQNNSVVVIKLNRSNDQLPPNAPQQITANYDEKNHSLHLQWSPPLVSKDGDRARSYVVLKDGIRLSFQFENEYEEKYVEDDSQYNYSIYAVDDAGNISNTGADFKISIPRDISKPEVTNIIIPNEETVIIQFDEPVDSVVAENIDHYVISQNIKIISANYQKNNKTVTLTTSEHSPANNYSLTIKKIADCAKIPNWLSNYPHSYQYEISYTDAFDQNTLSEYVWEQVKGTDNTVRRFFESEQKKLKVLTGDDTEIKFSHRLPKTSSGKFSMMFEAIEK